MTDIDFASLSDDELDRAQLVAEREAEALRRPGVPFREDAHKGADLSAKAARDMLDRVLGENVLDLTRPVKLPLVPPIGDLWPLAFDPTVLEAWHRAIDRASPELFAPLAKAEAEARRKALTDTLRAISAERRRRDIAERRADLEREEAALTT